MSDAAELRQALVSLGVTGRVEARGRLAVVTVPEAAIVGAAAVRSRLVEAAVAHGFASLALEVEDDPDDRAPVHRD